MIDHRLARHRHRDARHALAAAVVAHDDAAAVAAARRLLRAHDAVTRTVEHPTHREARTWRRWRRFALAALRSDPPCIGLLRRAEWLNFCQHNAALVAVDSGQPPNAIDTRRRREGENE